MTLVGLASKNPVKLAAALTGFQQMFAEGIGARGRARIAPGTPRRHSRALKAM
jgi:non-canonical (house-cleaning) NTP pyrophosphatase